MLAQPKLKSFLERVGLVVVVALVAVIVPLADQEQPAAAATCERGYIDGLVPLTDLGSGTYQGQMGGLYPGGSNSLPAAHATLGLSLAAAVEPLSSVGLPSPGGKIGLVSIGVSNTSGEFRELIVTPDPARAETVQLVNGAQSGEAVSDWVAPHAGAWSVLAERVAEAGLTTHQVQVAWVKLPERNPSLDFPLDAEQYVDDLSQVLRNLHDAYPNLRIAYLSSRIYGGYGESLSPEPFAYQHGFGVKWTIEAQIAGADLNADPQKGPTESPWLAWGPYLWANGVGPDSSQGGIPGRSDGLEWLCEDFRDDGIHPSDIGAAKVADMLREFFQTEPTACQWYLADPSACGVPPAEDDTASFLDIGDSPFADDIEWLRQMGITNGCNSAGTLFCPDGLVTRGQMAAFLTRALGLPAGPDVFVDDDGHLFEADIQALARAGITLGCGPGVFCPDGLVTRGQMAAFLTRALGLPAGPDVFVDDDGHLFEADIQALARAGITLGCGPGVFCPDGLVTRGQMAAFLHRSSNFIQG
jgi:hypothetical protein